MIYINVTRHKITRFILLSVSWLVQCSFSEANPVIAQVELSVVRPNKNVSQNPEGGRLLWWVQPLETCATVLVLLHDVILGLEGEGHTSNTEVDVREV